MGQTLLILIGIIGAIALFIVRKYNGIILRKNKRDQSFSDIDVQLKQRFDLVPQLLETVKGYMKHEKELLENITKARTGFMNAQNIEGKIAADNMLTSTLKTLFAVAENYPELKASDAFLRLQTRITTLEESISDRREFYNDTANTSNTRIEQFPDNLVASLFNFKTFDLMEFRQEEMKDIDISAEFGAKA